jgi:hypothetical protein
MTLGLLLVNGQQPGVGPDPRFDWSALCIELNTVTEDVLHTLKSCLLLNLSDHLGRHSRFDLFFDLLAGNGPACWFNFGHYNFSYGWVCGVLMGLDKIEVIKANSFFAS